MNQLFNRYNLIKNIFFSLFFRLKDFALHLFLFLFLSRSLSLACVIKFEALENDFSCLAYECVG